ncbi:sensor histidine kinase [Sphingomonas floccifaciens]|uniref:histidine kinase n=1 Tax=Sphingomonas floccifaciens TaxID=1844115 RepID=A0ABW4N9Y9_9SPHN
MTDTPTTEQPAATPAGSFARLPTGAKLFLILSAALLPFALIITFAAYQTTRVSDSENQARLRVAATEAARTMTIELIGDMNALRSALDAIERDPADALSCARVTGVFAPDMSAGGNFSIHDAAGRLRCGRDVPQAEGAIGMGIATGIAPERGLTLTIRGTNGVARATAFFPTKFLASVSRPSGFVPEYGAVLRAGDDSLTLRELDGPMLARRDALTVPVGVADLELVMTMASTPITSPVLIAMLLPLLMWAVAAGVGWFVVDRTLIRPLRRLSTSVVKYRPDGPFEAISIGAVPAHEIRELDQAFLGLGRTVQAHESDLAEGLVRQTRLTREVHHRVKNNLQVIASLINFHARGAASPEASAAYASIQRRVDALAVVHRHHFAEMEINRGLGLRSVIGELSANLRATAPEGTGRLSLVLDIEPFYVSQDVAVAVAFLTTELVELAMTIAPASQVRISLKADPESDDRAILRINSPALIEGDTLRDLLATRYGRVIEGLSRQLRTKLHHDPLVGAFEVIIAVVGRD